MQFTYLQLIASSLLVFGTSTVIAANGFAASCNNYYVTGTDLFADCLNADSSQRVATQVDLNYCLANNGGTLVCSEGGSYSYSCSNCELASGTYFQCACNAGSGTTGIDLNNCVGNSNGGLYC
ncbi:Cyanovirin-N [Hygrophoropsis aurantiaca]|uniref:Cyanovirin-N n=1 Tax=Hygrophoropsis aurantiaca TaxID=72124 RepID=A0ACB8ACP3_9AGAM|nr:Cyanovirin-N [Hygrophoropsis aurantiaca]